MKDFLKKYKFVLILIILIIFCLSVFVLVKRKDKDEVEKIKEVENVKNQEIKNDNDEKIDLGGGYFKLNNNIYYLNKLLDETDIDSFQVSGENYAKDKFNVYFGNLKIENADPNSFQTLEKAYSKDKNSVYYFGRVLKDADPNSLEILDFDLAKDKNFIFGFDKKLNVDHDSFQVLNIFFVKDKNNVFVLDPFTVLGDLNPKNTISFGKNYIGDDKNVYVAYSSYAGPYYFKLKGKVDIKTFKELNNLSDLNVDNIYGKDYNNCYNLDEIVPMSECDKVLKENN